jgi:hypothetical protein
MCWFAGKVINRSGRTGECRVEDLRVEKSAQTKACVKALSCSVISLYEVSGIIPGTSFLAHDLWLDGEPLR